MVDKNISDQIKRNEYIKSLLSLPPQKRDEKVLLELMSFTKSFKLFETIAMTNEHAFICKSMQLAHFKPNDVIVKQGEKGDSFFYILLGIVKIVISKKYDLGPTGGEIFIDKYIGDLKAGQTFGELSLIYGTERSATIISVTNSTMIKIDKLSFDTYVKDIFENQLKDQIDFMKICPVFHKIEKEKLIKLAIRSEIRKFTSNKTIITTNNSVEYFYLIRRCSVKVTKTISFVKDEKHLRKRIQNEMGLNLKKVVSFEDRKILREKLDERVNLELIKGPTSADIENNNYIEKEVLLETLRIGDIFPAFFTISGKKLDVSYISETPCDLIMIKLHDLCDMVYEAYLFIKNYAKPYPDNEFLRKYQFYQNQWNNFKKTVISNIKAEINNKEL